jgi:hypothetical protein
VSRTVFGVIQGLHYSENGKGINYTAVESKSDASFVESLRGLVKYCMTDKIANISVHGSCLRPAHKNL